MFIFCQRSYHRKCQQRRVGVQKKSQNCVKIVCERPLGSRETLMFFEMEECRATKNWAHFYKIKKGLGSNLIQVPAIKIIK